MRSWHNYCLMVVAACVASGLLSACGARLPGHYDSLPYRAAAGVNVDQGSGTSTAFYVTNRKPDGGGASTPYSSRRSDRIHYGTCDVRVPRVHTIGSDEVSAALSRVGVRPKAGHLEVTATREAQSPDAFFATLNQSVGTNPPKDVLLLVHGYNKSFAGPVARAAELAYDLGAPIVPIAYCWTSQGTFEGYPSDENDVDFAGRQLAVFIGQLLDGVPPGTRLHLVGHSMGARVMTQALARLRAARNFAGGTKPFKNLVFAAPDVDAAEFKSRILDDGVVGLADRTTCYAVVYDRALRASEYVHGRAYPRAGTAGVSILVIPGVDTVDVSLNDASIVGHSYYADNRAVIHDLHMLLVLDAPPERRNLYWAKKGNLTYYLIRP